MLRTRDQHCRTSRKIWVQNSKTVFSLQKCIYQTVIPVQECNYCTRMIYKAGLSFAWKQLPDCLASHTGKWPIHRLPLLYMPFIAWMQLANYQPALYFHYKIATTKLSYHCRNTTTRLPFNYMKVTTRMFFFCMNLTNKQPFLCINEPARLPCITWMQLPSGLDYMTKSLPFTTWTTIRQHFHNMKFP